MQSIFDDHESVIDLTYLDNLPLNAESYSAPLTDPLADSQRSWADIMDDDDSDFEIDDEISQTQVPASIPSQVPIIAPGLRPISPIPHNHDNVMVIAYQNHDNQASLNKQIATEKRQDRQHNGYVFTIHNWSPECIEAIKMAFDAHIDKIQYAAIGDELGKEDESPHLQGALFLKGKRRIRPSAFLRDYLAVLQHTCWPWWQSAWGTHKSNERYTGKEGRQVWEWGEPLPEDNQGNRNDLKRAFEIIEENVEHTDELELAGMIPSTYFKYNKAVLRLRALHYNKINKRRKITANGGPKIIWCFGKTRVGKSHFVRNTIGDRKYFVKNTGKWWCLYDQERILWMDDFRKEWMTYGSLLKVLDKYHLPIEFKGGSTSLGMVEEIYITAPWDPATMYGNKKDRANQLIERIYENGGSVIEFKKEETDDEQIVRWQEPWTRKDTLDKLEEIENAPQSDTFIVPPYNNNNY